MATIGGRPWAFVFARGGLIGFDPTTGRQDFHFPWRATILESVNAANPVVVGDEVLISETYGPGAALLRVKPGGCEVLWQDDPRQRRKILQTHWNTPIHHRGFVYASSGRHIPGGFLGVPHRLDRAVSGVLLLATTPRAARLLARQFERRQIAKTYLAVVAAASGSPAVPDTFEWHDTIRKVPDEPRAELVPAGTDGGREAVTTGRVREAATDPSLLELFPRTGRMHQLRVLAAARSLPVLGDIAYGG